MKSKLLILLLIIPIATQIAFAQTEKRLAFIRNEVALINKNVAKYRKETRNVEGISLEGTEAKYFISGRGLKKITAKSYGETYKATTELYYSGEELIFAYQKFYRYDTQIGMTPPPKIVRTEETRCYFDGGKVVKLLRGKANIKPDSEKWKETEDSMNDISGKLKNALFAQN